MSKTKQNSLNNNEACLIFMVATIIIAWLLVLQQSDGHYDAYMEGKKIVETIPFNDLQTSMFLNGTEIKVYPSAEYPDDKIVEYEIVRFPVENHAGKSVVVATYAGIRK